MSETLANRVGRLASGGFHALLDKAEDLAPEAVLMENVREIERAIDEVRTELGKTIGQKHLATKKLTEENSEHTQLGDNISTALAMGREDLAKAGIARQMDIEALIPVLQNTLSDCVFKEKELEGFILALQAKRREMLSAIEMLQNSRPVATAIPASSNLEQIALNAQKSGNAFDRVMARQTGLNLPNNGDMAQLSALKELEDLTRNKGVEERLAQLKQANIKQIGLDKS